MFGDLLKGIWGSVSNVFIAQVNGNETKEVLDE
jgi:hypothetical protein